MAEERTPREPRDLDTRENESRNRSWEPVRAEDHPEMQIMSDHGSDWAENGGIEVGGLLLCKAAKEEVESRQEYYSRHAQSQMQAVDNAYMRESDPRMPVLAPDRKTRVAFGSGSR